jgi:hypothetical protein
MKTEESMQGSLSARRRWVLFAVIVAGGLGAAERSWALCAARQEEGVWQNRNGDDPFQFEVRGGNCEVEGSPPFFVTVRVRQSGGALYTRGTFPAQWEKSDDGKWWIVPRAYGVGGYVEHPWLRYDNGSMRVWLWEESLDSKPSASKWHWFDRVGS